MKGKITLILAALAAVILAGSLIGYTFVSPYRLKLEEETALLEGEPVLVRTQLARASAFKGDAVSYVVQVWYDSDRVLRIDKTSLDETINFEPFEIRAMQESDVRFDSHTRVYQRDYEIQLIDGEVNRLYTFPTIVVRYQPEGSGGLLNKKTDPDALYVAARLPPDTLDLDLRPIQGQVSTVNHGRLASILWALGGVIGVLCIVEFVWRTVPRWKETVQQRRHVERIPVLAEGYRSLHQAAGAGGDPHRLLHQMDHIVRVVLARKEGIGPLDAAGGAAVDAEVEPIVASLLQRCQKAYRNGGAGPDDLEEALGELDAVLFHYFGEEEIRAWRT